MNGQPLKKKRKGGLSFGLDDDDDGVDRPAVLSRSPKTPDTHSREAGEDVDDAPSVRRRGPNSSIANAPKILTKSALRNEAEIKEKLRKEFLIMQEAVKATDIEIPFVFYDGTNIPGGACTIKKGEHIWLFLDRARKTGAQLGVGGDKARREWARVGVDDLMLVRGDIIIPHVCPELHFPIASAITRTDMSAALRLLLLHHQQIKGLQRSNLQLF